MNLNQFGLRSSSLTSRKQFQKAISAGCTEIQPVTELLDYGVTNAIFIDVFGYQWMLHQVHKEVSFEERMRLWAEKRINNHCWLHYGSYSKLVASRRVDRGRAG